MKYSLTFRTPEESVAGERILYDLSIDRAISAIVKDPQSCEVFLAFLSRPMQSIENIVYRQQILQDFIEMPELFDELTVIFRRYDRVKGDWVEMRAGVHPISAAASPEAVLDYTLSSLKVTAAFPRTIASYYASLAEILSKYEIRSEGLNAIRDYCRSMSSDEALGEIVEIASLFQYHTAESYDYGMIAHLDSTLRLLSCDLYDMEPRTKEKKFKLLSFLRNTEEEGVHCSNETADTGCIMLADALRRIDSALARITSEIYETFYGISRDMQFYDAALTLCAFLTDGGFPLCMPEMRPADEDVFEVTLLRDLLLASNGRSADAIVPVELTLESGLGLLIRGQNNTGKTTTLRALGCAQILAQAGLPVPAEHARLSIRSGVFTVFAAAEEEYRAGDNAGRFEGEVREIAHLLDAVQPHALVLINEIFQTTSYREGAEGMLHILHAFAHIPVKCIFVTHLLSLFDLCTASHAPYFLAETDYQRGKYLLFAASPAEDRTR